MIQVWYGYCALYFYYYCIGSTSQYQASDPGGWGPLIGSTSQYQASDPGGWGPLLKLIHLYHPPRLRITRFWLKEYNQIQWGKREFGFANIQFQISLQQLHFEYTIRGLKTETRYYNIINFYSSWFQRFFFEKSCIFFSPLHHRLLEPVLKGTGWHRSALWNI